MLGGATEALIGDGDAQGVDIVSREFGGYLREEKGPMVGNDDAHAGAIRTDPCEHDPRRCRQRGQRGTSRRGGIVLLGPFFDDDAAEAPVGTVVKPRPEALTLVRKSRLFVKDTDVSALKLPHAIATVYRTDPETLADSACSLHRHILLVPLPNPQNRTVRRVAKSRSRLGIQIAMASSDHTSVATVGTAGSDCFDAPAVDATTAPCFVRAPSDIAAEGLNGVQYVYGIGTGKPQPSVRWGPFVRSDRPAVLRFGADGRAQRMEVRMGHDCASRCNFCYLQRTSDHSWELVCTNCCVIEDDKGHLLFDPEVMSAYPPSQREPSRVNVKANLIGPNSFHMTEGGWHQANSTGSAASTSSSQPHPTILKNGEPAYLASTLTDPCWNDVADGDYARTVTHRIVTDPQEDASHAAKHGGVCAVELLFPYGLDDKHKQRQQDNWRANGSLGRGYPRASTKKRLYHGDPLDLLSRQANDGCTSTTIVVQWVLSWAEDEDTKQMRISFGNVHEVDFRVVPKQHLRNFETQWAKPLMEVGIRFLRIKSGMDVGVAINWQDVATATQQRKRNKFN